MGSHRIDRERRTIAVLIEMYCRAVHHPPQPGPCGECARLLAYAHARIDHCVFKNSKPACNRCPVHCYSRPTREAVRAVMRYSGPRMMLRHPLLAARHLVDGVRTGTPS